jgi:acylphosphatase
MISRSITYEGKVQGVGFRYFTLNIALDLNLNGFVQNLPNGNVYAEVTGNLEAVNEFIDKTSAGPPLSRVLNIVETDIPFHHQEKFRIKH